MAFKTKEQIENRRFEVVNSSLNSFKKLLSAPQLYGTGQECHLLTSDDLTIRRELLTSIKGGSAKFYDYLFIQKSGGHTVLICRWGRMNLVGVVTLSRMSVMSDKSMTHLQSIVDRRLKGTGGYQRVTLESDFHIHYQKEMVKSPAILQVVSNIFNLCKPPHDTSDSKLTAIVDFIINFHEDGEKGVLDNHLKENIEEVKQKALKMPNQHLFGSF